MLCKQSALPIRLPQYAGALPALMGLEMPLVRLLAAMEARGIALDAAVLEQQQPAMKKRMEQLQAAATALNGGVRVNLASPTDIRAVLFQQLKLPLPAHASGTRCDTSLRTPEGVHCAP
jgi:DNA polymerase I-like protein with 3'-5' exonuclease and polymerase domains